MQQYRYLVGGLIESVSPHEEEAKLNECATLGWELISVISKHHGGKPYTFFYFRRSISDEKREVEKPRFDIQFST